jgi:hypothetical protein
MTCSLLLDSKTVLVSLTLLLSRRIYPVLRALCRSDDQIRLNTQPSINQSSTQQQISVRPPEHGPALGVRATCRALRLARDDGAPSSLVKRNRKGLGTSRRSPLVRLLGAARPPR